MKSLLQEHINFTPLALPNPIGLAKNDPGVVWQRKRDVAFQQHIPTLRLQLQQPFNEYHRELQKTTVH